MFVITSIYNLKVHQIDVKPVFLNDDLEEIYIN